MSVRKVSLDASDFPAAISDLSASTGNLTAAGSNQATALLLDTTTYQRVGTVAAATGVRLPPAVAGTRIVVFNMGANALAVYPASAENINGGAVNASISIAAGKGAEFVCCVTGGWCSLNGA